MAWGTSSATYYSCEASNHQHDFEITDMKWMGVLYEKVSICKKCGSVYNFGFDIVSIPKAQLRGIDFSIYKMKGPTACSQQAFYAKKQAEALQWTPEQQVMWEKMLGVICRDIEEEAKHPHAYPIWRVTYNG